MFFADNRLLQGIGNRAEFFLTAHAPHLYCYLESREVLWVNLVTDSLIALSYAVIFGCLFWIAIRFRSLPQFRKYIWILLSFGVFIVACGGTHLMEVVDLWWPDFHLTAAMRIACALASVPTAILFARVTPLIAPDVRGFVEALASTQRQRDDAEVALTVSEAIAIERKQAAKDLAEVNQQLRSVMDSVSECILQIDHDWKILYGNHRALTTLPDFRLGADFWTCFPGMRSTAAEKHLRNAMETRSQEKFDNYYEPYDQWHRLYAFPTEEGISIFFFDITEEMKLSESLTAERVLREEHIESMSHMAGGLAHEISNPLGIIHAKASILQEAAGSEEPPSAQDVQAACASIVRTSDRAIQILRGLRGLSREASKDPMAAANLAAICDECVELQRSRFERHAIEMRLSMDRDLPLFSCREVQIGQVVSNLLNNAFDAIVQSGAADGWIALSVALRESSVVISVTDSGPGVSESAKKHLMEPFFTTKKVGLGMGVGLSLSRAIVKDHGGTLVLCEAGKHTCFELILPVQVAQEQGHAVLQEAL